MKSLRQVKLETVRLWTPDSITGCIDYFENGCLCIHSGKLPVLMDVSLQELVVHYMNGCVCSRHPAGELK